MNLLLHTVGENIGLVWWNYQKYFSGISSYKVDTDLGVPDVSFSRQVMSKTLKCSKQEQLETVGNIRVCQISLTSQFVENTGYSIEASFTGHIHKELMFLKSRELKQ